MRLQSIRDRFNTGCIAAVGHEACVLVGSLHAPGYTREIKLVIVLMCVVVRHIQLLLRLHSTDRVGSRRVHLRQKIAADDLLARLIQAASLALTDLPG